MKRQAWDPDDIDLISFNSAITACDKAQWTQLIWHSHLLPDSLGARQCKQWERALDLLSRMQQLGIKPDEASHMDRR